jgi:probable rRNA maturation factor
MPVYITCLPQDLKTDDVSIKEIKTFAENLLKAINNPEAELSVVLTNDDEIHRLNREWRRKDKPTDVLSFPQDCPPKDFPENFDPESFLKELVSNSSSCKVLGDIVISLDTARRQARELGWSLEEELKRLLLHGFVHLLGLDHEGSEESEEKFKAIEELLLLKARQTGNI